MLFVFFRVNLKFPYFLSPHLILSCAKQKALFASSAGTTKTSSSLST